MDWWLCDVNVGLQGGKTFCASFCASLITGSMRAFLFVNCVCVVLWEFWLRLNEIHEVRTFSCEAFLFVVVFSSLEKYFEFRTTNISVKTDHSVSLRWNKTFLNISKEVCIFLIIVHSICELILCPVLRLLSPGWIKTCLYSVISSYGYFIYMPRFIYFCKTSFILVFSQRTVMLTHASEQTCALLRF